MIRRAQRLPLTPQALKNGETIASPFFLLKFKPNGMQHHRFGVVVSVRAGKTAVIRHIIKRELLTIAAKWPLSRAGTAYDMLFIASPRLASLTTKEVRRVLREETAKISL